MTDNVSVPFRGYLFLNEKKGGIGMEVIVSVPFRGYLFLNLSYFSNNREHNAFPSPFGVIYFSIIRRIYQSHFQFWFPSPFGVIYFSMRLKFLVESGLIAFPSPFGVIYFSIIPEGWKCGENCFRPLSGLSISQYSPHHTLILLAFFSSLRRKTENLSKKAFLFLKLLPIP